MLAHLKRVVAMVLLLAANVACAAPALVPPAGFLAAAGHSTKDAPACAEPPAPFTGPLTFPSKYRQDIAAKDVIDPQAEAEYNARILPIRTLEKTVSSTVATYIHSGRKESLDCALRWLDAWASAHALEGEAQTHTGKSMRKWALGSIASAYDRLKFSTSQPLHGQGERRARIESWLDRLGTLVLADWKDQPREDINNHQYWAAWAAMADAVALNRRDLFDWAVSVYRTAAQQVDAEGYLGNELKRETRALAYHNYALAPLTMIAAFARANGVDLVAENDRALQRLANRVLGGIDDTSAFEDKTGDEQLTEDLQSTSKFAWLEPYCSLVGCDAATARRVESMRPLKTYRLGGNLTELFAARTGKSGSAGD
jgi:poly(beta-D-mannuronate) lyase